MNLVLGKLNYAYMIDAYHRSISPQAEPFEIHMDETLMRYFLTKVFGLNRVSMDTDDVHNILRSGVRFRAGLLVLNPALQPDMVWFRVQIDGRDETNLSTILKIDEEELLKCRIEK